MDCMVLQLPNNIADVATESPKTAIFLFIVITQPYFISVVGADGMPK